MPFVSYSNNILYSLHARMTDSESDDLGAELLAEDCRESPGQDPAYVVVEYEIVTGLRANSQLLYLPSEKQLYRKNTITKRGVHYKCKTDGCRIRIYMNNGICYKLIGVEHAHASSELSYIRLNALNEVKSRIIADKTTPIKEIFNYVVSR